MEVVQYAEHFSKISETFIYDYVTELEEQGCYPSVVTHNHHNSQERPFDRVRVVDWPGRWHPARLFHRIRLRNSKKPYVASFWPQVRSRLSPVVADIDPDVIHAQFGPMGVVMSPVARSLDIPLVVHFHGYDVSFLLPDAFWEEQYDALFDSASGLIGVSNHICEKLRQLGAPEEKIRLLHGGIRLAKFDYDPPTPRFDGKTVQCLHVGRLVEKKAPLDLIRAFSEAHQRAGDDVDLHLTIAGDGPMREDVEDLIAELGLSNHVQCLGNVSHERVVELMQESHLYTQHCKTASNGDQEGQGITFVEASATGLPIVTTRHNGIPDVVNDEETGLLVREGDVEAMGKKIAYLALHPEEWSSFSEAGRRRVKEKFDLTKQTRKLISIYEDVA
ncbi:glycosyltransferase [Salinibacter ruber]|uniref:glycosyltransferase n=1 Tax=Salinibacter ruber TaxID=146919 RepID=UPI00207376D4|nr:glycosyltransferase [Salinibacter ruber]